MLNVGVVGVLGGVGALERAHTIREALRPFEGQTVAVDFGQHPAARRWFSERGTSVEETSLSDAEEGVLRLPFTDVRVRPAHSTVEMGK